VTRRRYDRIPVRDVADFVNGWPRVSGYGPALAARYSIPVASARRWIHETRRRGLLPAHGAGRPCPRCRGTGALSWGGPRQ
jgi:hypothetical protein